jgi:hypothetical protein
MQRTLLRVLALTSMSAAFLAAQAIPGRYLVELEGEPAAEWLSRQAVHRAARAQRDRMLGGEFASRRAQVRRGQEPAVRAIAALGGRVTGRVDAVANALIVEIGDEQAARLSALPGVKRVLQDQALRHKLDRALVLGNFPEAYGLLPGGPETAGQGIRIAVLDSGLVTDHPGFKDDSLPPLDGFPKVTSENDRARVNSKLIVLRYFGRQGGTVTDTEGHGTAVSMVATGVPHQGPAGQMQGAAPKAYLGMYKVSTNLDIFEAFDQVLADGMDVVNMSFGFPPTIADYGSELLDRLDRAGVVLVAAAGNDGGFSSIDWPGSASSVLTVGGHQNDRTFGSGVAIEGGPSVQGFAGDNSVGQKAVTARLADAATIGDNLLGCNPFPANSLADRIVLVQRGTCSFEDKINNSQRAGAVAVIIYNQTQAAEGVRMAQASATLVAVWINNAPGLDLRERLRANPEVRVTVDPSGYLPFPISPNRISSFSSRGPSVYSTIKPEVLAAAGPILTAAQRTNPDGEVYGADGYSIIFGTSFSSPLAAGAIALVKQARPGLRPEQYRSLIVNSAVPFTIDNQDNRVATPNEGGTGKLNVANALRSPLTASPVVLTLGAAGNSVDVTKPLTFTNVSASADTFSISVERLTGTAVVTPDAETISLEPGASATVNVKISGQDLPFGSQQGHLVLRGTKTEAQVRVPYWYGVRGGDPKGVSIWQNQFTGSPGGTLRNAFLFRITDASGSILEDPKADVTPVGRGAVVDVRPTAGRAFAVDVRLGVTSGTYTFQVKAGDATELVQFVVP